MCRRWLFASRTPRSEVRSGRRAVGRLVYSANTLDRRARETDMHPLSSLSMDRGRPTCCQVTGPSWHSGDGVPRCCLDEELVGRLGSAFLRRPGGRTQLAAWALPPAIRSWPRSCILLLSTAGTDAPASIAVLTAPRPSFSARSPPGWGSSPRVRHLPPASDPRVTHWRRSGCPEVERGGPMERRP